jgi:hypothetical protein
MLFMAAALCLYTVPVAYHPDLPPGTLLGKTLGIPNGGAGMIRVFCMHQYTAAPDGYPSLLEVVSQVCEDSRRFCQQRENFTLNVLKFSAASWHSACAMQNPGSRIHKAIKPGCVIAGAQ